MRTKSIRNRNPLERMPKPPWSRETPLQELLVGHVAKQNREKRPTPARSKCNSRDLDKLLVKILDECIPVSFRPFCLPNIVHPRGGRITVFEEKSVAEKRTRVVVVEVICGRVNGRKGDRLE
jgi:hypothetical protein